MADSNEPQTGEEVCNFFRKPSNKNKNIRKRTLDTTDADAEAEAEEDPSQNPASSILHKPKKPPKPTTDLHFSSTTTTSSKNRPSQSEPNPSAGDDDDQPHSAAAIFHFESSSQIQVHNDSRATATLETETEFNRDARAIRERVLKQADESLRGKGKGKGRADEKVYRGMNAYTDYKAGFRREQTVAGEKAGGAHGPLRASAHIRSSMRFDYQPDICKDYKETGYCGFGDSCKFMHDRGDYKSGWQMEREWDEAEKVRKRNLALGGGEDGDGVAERGGGGGGRDADDDDDEDSLPFACFICRQPFQDPVVTKCKHYFCEHCALKHHSRNKKCYVCNKPTLGIFNTAHEIKKKMAEEK